MLRNNAHKERPNATSRARELRKNMNLSEQKFWAFCRKNRIGFKFCRQVPIGPFTVDFYCQEAMVAVEVDGEIHQERELQDAFRDALLKEYRVTVVRIPSLALWDEKHPQAPSWFDDLADALEKSTGRRARWPL